MFDRLYLLANGHCIYQGPTSQVIDFIEKATGIICPIYHSAVIYELNLTTKLQTTTDCNKILFHRPILVFLK